MKEDTIVYLHEPVSILRWKITLGLTCRFLILCQLVNAVLTSGHFTFKNHFHSHMHKQ
jgi:hypothetical protein